VRSLQKHYPDLRILVGDDAHLIDEMVREAPEEAYGEAFMERLRASTEWNIS